MRAMHWLLVATLAIMMTGTPMVPAAAKGERAGCLIVTNDTNSEITLHVVGRLAGGDWKVPRNSTWVLNDRGQDPIGNIVVDEDTLVWSTTGTANSVKLPLMKIPDSAYHPETGRSDCVDGAAWYLTLGASAPSVAPGVGTAASSVAPASVANRYAITPGVGIGMVRLGMEVGPDVVAVLGQWASRIENGDGSVFYRWYPYTTDANGTHHGGGVNVLERDGVIVRLSVYHAPEYSVSGVATGMTEAQVRAILGEPLGTATAAPAGPSDTPAKILSYGGIDLWISQTPNDADGDYQKVFQIDVVQTRAPAPSVIPRARIIPGLGIGAVHLGMNVVHDVVPLLGLWKYSIVNPNGTLFFRWYDYSTDSNGVHHGGGVNMLERDGAVVQLSVYHAPDYVVEGISTGATETQVRAALGAPTQVTAVSSGTAGEIPDKVLWYNGVGFWISQAPHDPDGDYQKVYQIGVVPGAEAAPAVVTAPRPVPIAPGAGIGSLRLGMNVLHDVVPLLGTWTYSVVNPDGSRFYRWYDYAVDARGAHHGGGVNVLERDGAVVQLSVYHAPDYTVDGVATGATEAQVRAALGEPIHVTSASSPGAAKELSYPGINLWVSEAPDDPDGDYGRVFQITVVLQ